MYAALRNEYVFVVRTVEGVSARERSRLKLHYLPDIRKDTPSPKTKGVSIELSILKKADFVQD